MLIDIRTGKYIIICNSYSDIDNVFKAISWKDKVSFGKIDLIKRYFNENGTIGIRIKNSEYCYYDTADRYFEFKREFADYEIINACDIIGDFNNEYFDDISFDDISILI